MRSTGNILNEDLDTKFIHTSQHMNELLRKDGNILSSCDEKSRKLDEYFVEAGDSTGGSFIRESIIFFPDEKRSKRAE